VHNDHLKLSKIMEFGIG